MKNNRVTVIGVLQDKFIYSHEVRGELFFCNRILIPRDSGVPDIIDLIVSEKLINNDFITGNLVCVSGSFRSRNFRIEGKNRLFLYIFAEDMLIHVNDSKVVQNEIELSCYVCKDPIYRITPLYREITELIVAVNRETNKSDYIPCLAWGRIARYAKLLSVGSKLHITGRIQSRTYTKDGNVRMAYEVSISKLSDTTD